MAVFKGSGPILEKLKKQIISIFKEEGLKLVSKTVFSHKTDFLDITMDLKSGKFRPLKKPNNEIKYVSAESNHPPNIIKQIPNIIKSRITNLCSYENCFKDATNKYEEALESAGYGKINFNGNWFY